MSPAWLRFLPAPLRARLEHRPNLHKILGNTGWLFGDRVVRMGIGLVVGVWVARYLGPAQFGLMNYAVAIVALFGTVANLGLNGIVVRDLVKSPERAYSILGTAFVLQFLGGLVASGLAIVVIDVLRPSGDLARGLVAILAFSLVFKSTEVVKCWFESQVKSRYTVWAENGAFLLLSAAKVGLIMLRAPLVAFIWAALAETALVAVLLLFVYARKAGNPMAWRASLARAKSLLSESWPLILASVASMINMRMDQVMLGAMTSDSVVGNYSAAVRVSEVWFMIPVILGASIYPTIIAAKESSEVLYRTRIRKVSRTMALVVLPAAFMIAIGANEITAVLYGKAYSSAGQYLSIHIWSGVPYLIFFVFNQMFYIEKLTKLSFYVAVFSVLSNLSLNLLLIPAYGGIGAAVATLITAVGANALSLFVLNSRTGILFGGGREKE